VIQKKRYYALGCTSAPEISSLDLQRDYGNGWFMALFVSHVEIRSLAEVC
jgi:hypothetical protein